MNIMNRILIMYQIMPNPDWAIVANWAILDLEIRIFGYGTDIAKKKLKNQQRI